MTTKGQFEALQNLCEKGRKKLLFFWVILKGADFFLAHNYTQAEWKPFKLTFWLIHHKNK